MEEVKVKLQEVDILLVLRYINPKVYVTKEKKKKKKKYSDQNEKVYFLCHSLYKNIYILKKKI